MAQCKTAVSPLLTHWRYCSLELSHRYTFPTWIHMLLQSWLHLSMGETNTHCYIFCHWLRPCEGMQRKLAYWPIHLTSIRIPIIDNGNPYTGKASLYWIGSQKLLRCIFPGNAQMKQSLYFLGQLISIQWRQMSAMTSQITATGLFGQQLAQALKR